MSISKDEVMKRLNLLVDDDSMVSAGKKFMKWNDWEDPEKWDVHEYLDKIKKEKSKNYARFSYYAIKRAFEALEKEWPLSRSDLPKKPSDSERKTPSFSKDKIGEIINEIKKKGYDYEKFFLCLSTTYGMRRKEIWLIEEDDLMFKKRDYSRKEKDTSYPNTDTIYIKTRKGGEQREQYIPPQIKPHLENYGFNREFKNIKTMNDVFDDILRKVKVKKKKRMGWHTFRRSLRTDLGRELRRIRKEGGAGVLEGDIAKFGRWQQRGIDKILGIYDQEDPVVGDKEMFKIHPYIDFWSGDNG